MGDRARRILVADDDEDLANLMAMNLRKEGFEVEVAYDGRMALHKIQNKEIELAILDVRMPYLDGYLVAEQVREIKDVPLILVSSMGQERDRIRGLEAGGDLYLTKPVSKQELLLYVKRMLKMHIQTRKPEYRIGNISIDEEKGCLIVGEEERRLTKSELCIAKLLMGNPGHIYTKHQLYEACRGLDAIYDEQAVAVHLSHLRDKMGDDAKNPRYIETIRGLGYRMKKNEDEKIN